MKTNREIVSAADQAVLTHPRLRELATSDKVLIGVNTAIAEVAEHLEALAAEEVSDEGPGPGTYITDLQYSVAAALRSAAASVRELGTS